jgi:predicted nucleic acid-binding protein
MICYVDSSVVLRHLLNQPHHLKEWEKVSRFFSSRLVKLECLRTLDRWRLRFSVDAEEMSFRLVGFQEMMTRMSLLPLTETVLRKSEQSFHVPVGSLDSIHLATALSWREKHGDDFVFATHDEELGLAAKTYGLTVIGLR